MDNDGAARDLAFVRGVMESTHLSTLAPGIYFILWGTLIVAGLGYSLLQVAHSLALSPWVVWLGLVACGWGISWTLSVREKRQGRTSSAAGRALAAIWMACGISVTVALFVGLGAAVVRTAAVPGMLACFLAIGMVATGLLAGVRWVTVIGGLWWVCAVGLFLVSERAAVMALAICVLLLMVLPGVVLEVRAPSSGLRGPRG